MMASYETMAGCGRFNKRVKINSILFFVKRKEISKDEQNHLRKAPTEKNPDKFAFWKQTTMAAGKELKTNLTLDLLFNGTKQKH